MDELNIGDVVQVTEGEYSRVYTFAHLDPENWTRYLQIHFHGQKRPLEVSHRHIVYVDGLAMEAGNLTVGNVLGKGKIIAKIHGITRRGQFAPITEHGDIEVSGVVVSSYVSVFNYNPSIQNKLFHVMLAPVRLACNFLPCDLDPYVGGFPIWLSPQLLDGVSLLPVTAQYVVSFIAAAPVFLIYLLEKLVFQLGPLLVVFLFVALWVRTNDACSVREAQVMPKVKAAKTTQ